jgi:hypothetical protein
VGSSLRLESTKGNIQIRAFSFWLNGTILSRQGLYLSGIFSNLEASNMTTLPAGLIRALDIFLIATVEKTNEKITFITINYFVAHNTNGTDKTARFHSRNGD